MEGEWGEALRFAAAGDSFGTASGGLESVGCGVGGHAACRVGMDVVGLDRNPDMHPGVGIAIPTYGWLRDGRAISHWLASECRTSGVRNFSVRRSMFVVQRSALPIRLLSVSLSIPQTNIFWLAVQWSR